MFLKYLSTLIKRTWRNWMESKWDILIVFISVWYAITTITLMVTNLYPKLLTILMIPFIAFIVIACIIMVGVTLLAFILAMYDGFKKQVKQYKKWKEDYQKGIKK